MIVCANCAHQNPDGATQCEACYTPLLQALPTGNASTPDDFSGKILPLPLEGEPTTGASPMPPVANAASTFQLDPNLSAAVVNPTPSIAAAPKTQLQQANARLLHVQTNTVLELPSHLSIVHIGKPNDRIPPDIDVSGFADSDIVSRIHADIRVEGEAYYIEDVGSSNGTYINSLPLPTGNRHRLRPGDRIALGKGDRMSFLFQITSATGVG
jgi:hypothetical protein